MMNDATACPLCEEASEVVSVLYKQVPDFRFESTPGDRFDIYLCTRCRLLITDLEGVEVSHFYPETYGAHSIQDGEETLIKQLHKKYKKKITSIFEPDPLDIVQKHLRSGRVLDVGCGSGDFLNQCRDEGFEVVGCDVSATAVGNARSEYNLEVRRGELHCLDFERNSFDAIVFNHSFEHVDKPREYISEVDNILSNDGYVFINVPNFHSVEHSLFKRFWTDLDIPRHVYNWSPKSLDILMESFGFSSVEKTFTDSPRQLSASFSRYIDEKIGIEVPTSVVFDPLFLIPSVYNGARSNTGRLFSVYQQPRPNP